MILKIFPVSQIYFERHNVEKMVAKHLILSQRSMYNITFIYVQTHMKCWFAYFFTLKKPLIIHIEVFGITYKKFF